MATIIDNIELDETNVEFNYASDFVKHTDRLVYLTGKAGTGKTTFLKYLRETTTKNTVILAPTGVAAINAGGQTIHSFFQIKPSVYVPDDKRLRTRADLNDSDRSTIFDHFKYFKERLEIIRGLDLLIIDEFGVQTGSDTEKLILFRIVNKRYEYLKPTILITNLSVAEIKKFEERIFDRLKDNGILLNFSGESNRKSKKI